MKPYSSDFSNSAVDPRTRRLGAIIRLIGSNPGITLTKLHKLLLARGIEVTERTIAKDILLLKEAYGLLPNKERLRAGYYLEEICSLAEKEVSMVLDAMHVFGVHLNDPEARTLTARLKSLSGQLGQSPVRERTLRERDIYGDRTGKRASVQDVLLKAIRAHMPVLVTYKTPRLRQVKQYREYPLYLVFHERGWYCLSREISAANYFARRLDRIQQCKLIESAQPNGSHENDLSTAQLLVNSGWGMTFPHNLKELANAQAQNEIVARFDSSVADYIMESGQRHPKGKATRMKDGSGDVEFRIKLADAREFVFWVRSFGAAARIIAPTSLVESEKAELRRMAKKYGVG